MPVPSSSTAAVPLISSFFRLFLGFGEFPCAYSFLVHTTTLCDRIFLTTTWNSRVFPQNLPLGIPSGSPLAKTTFMVYVGSFAKTTLPLMAASWSFCKDHPLGHDRLLAMSWSFTNTTLFWVGPPLSLRPLAFLVFG